MKKIPADFRPRHRGASRLQRRARRPAIKLAVLVVFAIVGAVR